MPFGQSLSLRVIILLVTLLSLVNAQKYTLCQNLSGDNFASRYNESAADINFGNVHYVSQSDAVASKLTYVDADGRVIVKVDNTTNGAGNSMFERNSVYLESNQLIGELRVEMPKRWYAGALVVR
ncbi:hypothetical protein C8R44DRAFT_866230 [Mycena epipterygia]|nr:hypothetical protein C8R44DRAFT_866230 [Mycena epipterygia]